MKKDRIGRTVRILGESFLPWQQEPLECWEARKWGGGEAGESGGPGADLGLQRRRRCRCDTSDSAKVALGHQEWAGIHILMRVRWALGPAAAKSDYHFHRSAQNPGEMFLPVLSEPPNTNKSLDAAGNKFLCTSDNQFAVQDSAGVEFWTWIWGFSGPAEPVEGLQ